MCNVNDGWSSEYKVPFDWDYFLYLIEKGYIDNYEIDISTTNDNNDEAAPDNR